MLPLHRLVHLIETQSETLAADLTQQIKSSPLTTAYRSVPDDELHHRIYENYRHLGDWLLAKDDRQVERRYLKIGAERARQHVPLSQIAWVLVFAKQSLWKLLKNEVDGQQPGEPGETVALLFLLDHFFDQALCYAATGHEHYRETSAG